MKQISMREAQINLAKYLSELPIEITRYGKVIAQIVEPEEVIIENVTLKQATTPQRMEKVLIEKPEKSPLQYNSPIPVEKPPEVTTAVQNEELKPVPNPVPSEPIPVTNSRCQYSNCFKQSVGQYRVIVFVEGEEKKKDMYLCYYHLNTARREGMKPEKL